MPVARASFPSLGNAREGGDPASPRAREVGEGRNREREEAERNGRRERASKGRLAHSVDLSWLPSDEHPPPGSSPDYPWSGHILKTGGWRRWRHLARRNTQPAGGHPRGPRPRRDSRAMHSTLAGSRLGAAGPPFRAADALFASDTPRLAAAKQQPQQHGHRTPSPAPFDHRRVATFSSSRDRRLLPLAPARLLHRAASSPVPPWDSVGWRGPPSATGRHLASASR